MARKTVKCKSGLMGWQNKLRGEYSSFTAFKVWSEMWGLHSRLGYKTAKSAWRWNPTVQGSVIPTDYRRVRK